MKNLNIENVSLIDDNLIGIYIIKNKINNKCYIGQSIELRKRLRNHISLASGSKKDKYPLYRAINKYGFENFDFEILYSAVKDINIIIEQRNLLNEYEQKYIIEYESFGKNGYNQTNGSEAMNGAGTLGYKFSEDQLVNLSKVQRKLYKDNVDDPYYVYNIKSEEFYEFKNGLVFKEYFKIALNDNMRRSKSENTQCGFSLYREKLIVTSSKEDLNIQINNYNIFKNSEFKHLPGQFQEVIQNVYCYNYILESYYTFYSLKQTCKCLNKSNSAINNIKTRKTRSTDGWITSLDKNELEELKIINQPSKIVKNRYKKLNVEILKYPYISIKITKNEIK